MFWSFDFGLGDAATSGIAKKSCRCGIPATTTLTTTAKMRPLNSYDVEVVEVVVEVVVSARVHVAKELVTGTEP